MFSGVSRAEGTEDFREFRLCVNYVRPSGQGDVIASKRRARGLSKVGHVEVWPGLDSESDGPCYVVAVIYHQTLLYQQPC